MCTAPPLSPTRRDGSAGHLTRAQHICMLLVLSGCLGCLVCPGCVGCPGCIYVARASFATPPGSSGRLRATPATLATWAGSPATIQPVLAQHRHWAGDVSVLMLHWCCTGTEPGSCRVPVLYLHSNGTVLLQYRAMLCCNVQCSTGRVLRWPGAVLVLDGQFVGMSVVLY